MHPKTLAVLFELSNLKDPDFHAVLDEARMQRPWRPHRTGLVNVTDQLLHAAYGALIVLPVLLLPPVVGAMLAAGILGAIRETEQYFHQDMHILMLGDRVVDVLFFALGAGVLAWLL